MKGLIFICLLTISLFSGSNQKVEWLTTMEHDFGEIRQKKPVQFDFEFKNISGEPLVIDNVRTSCGCTAPEWSFEPIDIDDKDRIRVVYDAKKQGYFYKKVKVFFNGQRKADLLTIEGFVE